MLGLLAFTSAPTNGSGGSGQTRAEQNHRRRLRDRRRGGNQGRNSGDAARGVRVEEQRIAARQVRQLIGHTPDHHLRGRKHDPRVAALPATDDGAGERAGEIAAATRRRRLNDAQRERGGRKSAAP